MSNPAFSFSRVWDDTVAMLRANAGLLTALAGAFLFLPGVLLARYLPPPEGGDTPAQMFEMVMAWWQANLGWMMLAGVVNMIGIIAIYLLLLRADRLTVGGAMVAALSILPFYLVLTIVLNFAVSIGFFLLIVPGVYLLGRLALASPVLVAEMPRAPFAALARSWSLSAASAWRIALLVLLVYFAAVIVNAAIGSAVGVVILLALGNEGVGGLLVAAVEAALGAATTLLATVLIAAIYRALMARPELAQRFT
jgi:hypothetical protein